MEAQVGCCSRSDGQQSGSTGINITLFLTMYIYIFVQINNLFVDYYNTAFQYGDTLYTGLKNSELVLNGNKYTGDDLIVKSKSVIDTAKQGNSSLLGWVVETRNSGEATWNDILKSAEELMKKLQGNPAMQFTINSLQQIITMLAQLRYSTTKDSVINQKLLNFKICQILIQHRSQILHTYYNTSLIL